MKYLNKDTLSEIKESICFRNIKFDEKEKKGRMNKNGEEYFYYIILEYEGEFKNGKRNGKGKEYDNNENLIFEGEYKNNEKWNGMFKEYDHNGKLLFEYELINGKRKVKEKKFNKNDKFIFEDGNKIWKNLNFKKKESYDNKNLLYKNENINSKKDISKRKKIIVRETYPNFNLLDVTLELEKMIEGEQIEGGIIDNTCFLKEAISEVEFLYGDSQNGKFKEHNKTRNVFFEGEYINGIKYGKEFEHKGNLIFKGNYNTLGERFNGLGKEYYENGTINFNGEYICWEKIGKGYDKSGKIISKVNQQKIENWKSLTRNNWNEYIGISGKRIVKYPRNDNENFIQKEYDINGNLILKEEFSSGKRMKWKRKIYDNKNNLLFDIDYVKNSIIKEKGILLEIYSTFEGYNGLKIEIGKEIDFKNNSIFYGEFSKGIKLNGTIKIYNNLMINENINNFEDIKNERNKEIIFDFWKWI